MSASLINSPALTTEKAKGMGLGLYCRLAVQGHGGKIWVESEPGAGAKFTFTLPFIKDVIIKDVIIQT
jgi:signal transduction histidine kinase